MIWFANMSIIIFFSQFWGGEHLFSAGRAAISASLTQELLQTWMFGSLTSALERMCEPAHEVGKDSKAHAVVHTSLVSGVSYGLHLMNFNLNVTIFIEWQSDLTECKTKKPLQWEFGQGQVEILPMGSFSLFCEVPENLQFCRRRM